MEQPAEEEEGEATLATEPSASSDSVRRARQAAPASKPTLEDDNIIVTAVDSEQKKKQQQQQKSTGRRSKQQLEEKLVLRQREAAASDTLVPTSAHTTGKPLQQKRASRVKTCRPAPVILQVCARQPDEFLLTLASSAAPPVGLKPALS